MIAVETKNLFRSFKRKGSEFWALDDVSIEVPGGVIYGLLGPNGAGKTTLIKILTTLLYPTSGKAYVGGYDVVEEARKVRALISLVVGGESMGYGILTVEEHLWVFSQFYGVETKVVRQRIREYLDQFGIAELAKVKMNRLSTGQRQKVHIIRGLITDPKIFFLDEPTLGLDVPTSKMIRSFLKEWVAAKPDRTVFLSTHNMHEAEEIADIVAVIHRGRLIASGKPKELISAHADVPRFRLKVDRSLAELESESDRFKLLASESSNGIYTYEVEAKSDSDLLELVWGRERDGLKIYELTRVEPTLEELFLKITGGETG